LKIPIVLPDGRQLLTLKDAARLRNEVAEEGIRPNGMANGNRSIDAVQPRRTRDDGADLMKALTPRNINGASDS
jgi:hypothetical protein